MVPIIIPIPGKASAFTHGVLWKGVRCERCGCEYVYRVARSGEASQHFYGGGGLAVAGTSDAAHHDLQAQLWAAVEPAPCPDCHWLQADMIHAAREQLYPRVRAKSWLWSLIGAGVGGLVLAAVVFGGQTLWVPAPIRMPAYGRSRSPLPARPSRCCRPAWGSIAGAPRDVQPQ